jgi:hypothetical protein
LTWVFRNAKFLLLLSKKRETFAFLILTGDYMNKKLATLLFAIGFGAAAGSALAFPGDDPTCEQQCFTTYQANLAAGQDPDQARMDYMDCRDRCGI